MRDDVAEKERVAVGRRARGHFGGDDHAAARAVIDDHRLAEHLAELGRNLTGAQVGGASRRVGHDEPQRLDRIALRAGMEGDRRQADERRCESKIHGSSLEAYFKDENATPARISAMPAKWYQPGYSASKSAESTTPNAGMRCMVTPARTAPMRFTT